MEKGNLPESGHTQTEAVLGEHEHGYWGKPSVLFDRRVNPREIKEIPGLDICCAYADTEICGRCGGC